MNITKQSHRQKQQTNREQWGEEVGRGTIRVGDEKVQTTFVVCIK